jgi:acyl carrier protein
LRPENPTAAIRDFIGNDLLYDPSIEIGVDDQLLLDGLVDSLSIARLVIFVEESWQINIPPGDVSIENFGTIEAIVGYADGRVSQQQG